MPSRLIVAWRQRKISAMSVKEQILAAIHRLPADIDYRDAAEEIALLAGLREAEEDIAHGRVVSNEEMKNRIARWSEG